MNKIFLIILFSFLGFIFNEEIFFNVTNDNYRNTFEKLTKGNIYNFVFPVVPFENISFAIATNKTYRFSPNISIYNYISYSSNYSERNLQKKLTNKLKEINGEYTYSYEIYLNDNNSEYLGIQLTMQKYLNYLTLTIIANNKINFQNYYGNYRGKLFAFIPYYFFINVDNKEKFEIIVYSESLPNQPFEEYYITEYDQDNKTLHSYKSIAKYFTQGSKLNSINSIISKGSTKKVSYKFIPNFDIEDFFIMIDTPYDGPYDEPSEEIVINYGNIIGLIFFAAIIVVIIFAIYYCCIKPKNSSYNIEYQYHPQNPPLVDSN